MSRGFPSQGETRGGALFWLIWAALGTAASALFVKFHPGRPPFSLPGLDGAGPDWAGHIRAVGGLAILLALAWPSGTLLFRRARERASLTGCLAGGVVLLAHAAWLLAATGILRWYVLIPVALGPLIFVRPETSLLHFRIRTTPGGLMLALPAVAMFGLVLLRSLAPATANDAMVYHFEIARRVAETGTHALPAESIYGHMPHLGALAFAAAWLFGAEGAALLLRVAALAGLAVTAARIGRTVAPPARGSFAPLGMLLVFAHPILLDPRTFGNVDLFSALLFLLAAEQILLCRSDPVGMRPGAFIPAGVFAGAFLAIKLSNVFLAPLLVALFVIRGKRISMSGFMWFLVWSALPIIPWLVRSAIVSGHPLFPVVPGDSSVWDAALAERLRNWQLSMGMGRTPRDMLLLPFRLFFEGDRGYHRFDGSVHPILLLALIPAARFGGAPARYAIAAGIAGIWLWALGPQQLRFFLPVLFFLAAASSWDWLPARGTKLRPAVVAFLVMSVGAGLIGPARELVHDTIPVVAGKESRESYRARQVQSDEALRNITRLVPPGEKVLFLWENRMYGFDRPYIVDSFFEASQIARLAERSGTPQAFAERMEERGVRWVAVNRSLERVFSRGYPRSTMEVLGAYVSELEPVGAWKGIELYRVPGATR